MDPQKLSLLHNLLEPLDKGNRNMLNHFWYFCSSWINTGRTIEMFKSSYKLQNRRIRSCISSCILPFKVKTSLTLLYPSVLGYWLLRVCPHLYAWRAELHSFLGWGGHRRFHLGGGAAVSPEPFCVRNPGLGATCHHVLTHMDATETRCSPTTHRRNKPGFRMPIPGLDLKEYYRIWFVLSRRVVTTPEQLANAGLAVASKQSINVIVYNNIKVSWHYQLLYWFIPSTLPRKVQYSCLWRTYHRSPNEWHLS